MFDDRYWKYDEQDSPFYVPPKPENYYEPMWTPQRCSRSAIEDHTEDKHREDLENMISSLIPPWMKKNNK